MNDYENCPHKYFLRYIQKIDRPPTEIQLRGIKGHRIFHNFFKNFNPDKKFSEQIEYQEEFDTEIINFLKFERKRSMENKEFFKPVFLEKEISNSVLNYRGIIDRVDEYDDGYVIVDYKLGKIRNDFMQLYGYYYLLKNSGLINKRIKRLDYVFLKYGIIVSSRIMKCDIEEFLAKVSKIKFMIEEDKKFEPNITRLCDWCEYKEDCITRGGKL